ncbi:MULTISPECIES: hypothetical protein [unclassified Streptomyces]|uniref:hypothetical protein n=1 Tax=unclassified Streptomyces TaxID=2593676 RepID=UPI0035DA2E0A
MAITPGHPSRESVLAALRAAAVREESFGPQGGLPEKVRVDRGKDFLSRTVTAAFNALDVTVEDLPPYTPHLKGTVEGLNRAVESMFLAALPGYVRQPRPGRRRARPKDEALLDFEDFTTCLLDWWNTSHHPRPLRAVPRFRRGRRIRRRCETPARTSCGRSPQRDRLHAECREGTSHCDRTEFLRMPRSGAQPGELSGCQHERQEQVARRLHNVFERRSRPRW